MLEQYFVRPETIDRIRSSWIAPAIERYVAWLTEEDYRPRNVYRRVPILVRFGEFAASRGATTLQELPEHAVSLLAGEARVPVEQMLRLVVPGFEGVGRPKAATPFREAAPGFVAYLREERGLRESTILQYGHHLRRFEQYLGRIRLDDLDALTPAVLSAFVVDSSTGLAKTSLRDRCGVLRVFLRYLHREQLVRRDLSATVESPQVYRLSEIPRSISWNDVGRVLEGVDRRSPTGKRDYAILLLLVTYGLRAREVAALSLDHVDWRSERLRIPERKAGHSTAFPLSPIVGEALLEYIQQGRPKSSCRQVFLRALAPHRPVTQGAVSARAAHYLRKAGLNVPRPGSHTLRHTCVQRLVDADFSLKQIGDFVGHRSPSSTEIYSKVAVESLRELALGDGEDVL
jgi:site-specific recombinase XerD